MFQLVCEFGFQLIRPIIEIVMTRSGYPKDAINRKNAIIQENGFTKDDKVLMFHGVSVGEIVALEHLIKETRKIFPDIKIVVTTGTHTGQDIAKKKLGDFVDLITYFPFDCPSIINKFLNKISPDIIMIAETEIWPNFAIACKKRNIKLYAINGRISDSTFKTYEKFKIIFKYFLHLYTGIFTQSDDDNNKFLILGANPETTKKMNNLKFDINKPELTFSIDKSDSRVLLAGSTHQGEDEIILDCFKNLKNQHDDLKLILAPRHLTRVGEISELIEARHFSFAKRSDNVASLKDIDILLLDTLGELGKMYAFSDISFIGGSFNQTGGHNPLESIVWGKPVISGPSIHNFKDIYNIIKKANAGFVVKSSEELFNIADKLLMDKQFYADTVNNCDKVFKEQQGALEFVIKVISENFHVKII